MTEASQPSSLETWGQYNEKSRTAYRSMALAKMILAQRARSTVYPRQQGLYVANPMKLPLSGWITMPASSLRGDFHSLEDSQTGASIPLVFEPGYRQFGRPSSPEEFTSENTSQTFPDHSPNQVVRFWIDDWVQYTTPQGRWLWVSRDAPLATFGDHQILARRTTPPDESSRIPAMVFNNVWLTNFVADSHGVLEFQFDMAWRKPDATAGDPSALAETLQTDPQVIINPGLEEHPIFMHRLHRP